VSGHYEHFGKYILLEKLATGGMAEVFLGRGTGAGGIGKFFAIKRILPQYADSPEFIEMFKDEAKIAINLNHSNIVSIHEFGVEKGQFFLVMDYVEGRNLRQILNKMKKSSMQFSIDQIVYVIKEVGAGLDHAHRCIDGSTGKPLNITHRDMSPQNIMVSFEGETKIVDFGIAKAESQIESTRAGTLKGKFGYMSPEQAEGQPVDLRTDIFSLGIVLWELLAGDRLFVANNEINTLRKIRDCQIPSLRKINPNIHSELERIVQKALARDRNLRYQTGAALQRDLNRFLNRQYPDFSPQDFSVFVKSVFADEILSLRKRLVEYSKVNLTISLNLGRRERGEDTSLLDSDTGSQIPVTNSEISGAADMPSVNSDILSHEDLVSSSKKAPQLTQPARKNRDDEDSMVTASTPTGASLPSMPSLQVHTQTSTRVQGDEKAEANPGLLDDAALKIAVGSLKDKEMPTPRIQPIEIKPGDVMQAADLSVPEPAAEMQQPQRPLIRSSPGRSMGSSGSRGSSSRSREESGFPRAATFAIFLFICLTVYSYMAKSFTTTMAPLISVTHPYLGWLHSAIGVAPPDVLAPGAVHQQAAHKTRGQDPFEPNATGLVVTSNPSGAEIIVNEQSTGMVTPSRIEVTGSFSIRIKKKGYEEFAVADATRETVGHRLDATLVKLNVAYLDVEIFPPQPATLYINGKQYQIRRSSVREIPIPGGTPVKVRAESVGANTFEELIISVPVDKRKVVQLNPRKTTRQPTGNP
jgi:serine/threonine protein kinase